MAEKKRTSASEKTAQPSKKSKNVAADTTAAQVEELLKASKAAPVDTEETKPAKKQRKRASDFLEETSSHPEAAVSKKNKKSKKSAQSLTADGANGIVENADTADVEITTAAPNVANSLMAEAENTQDNELAEQFAASDDEADIDAAPALLTGFDSDNDDPAEDTADLKANGPVAPLPQYKKTTKKLRSVPKTTDKPGAVYVGRIPHGFYEPQMREYFSQFGDISRLRLSRNKKTGASKHFAFIEFHNEEVAKIVAETMDNYLMFGHILKCKFAPEGSLHEDVWKGANKKFRKIPTHKLLREKEQGPKSVAKWEKKTNKEAKTRKTRAEKLKAIGYEFEAPELKKASEVTHTVAGDEGTTSAIEDTKPVGAIEPPPNVPKDELAAKKAEEKTVKTKKSKAKQNGADAEEKRNTIVEETTRAEIDAAMKVDKKTTKSKAKGKATGVSAQDAAKPKGILKKSKKA